MDSVKNKYILTSTFNYKFSNGSEHIFQILLHRQAVTVRCNFMTDLELILINKFAATEERLEGHLIYLKNYGLTKLNQPRLGQKTNLDFYRAKFFTGYRKFSKIDIVIGVSADNKEIFLLTNPLFSDKYSNLIEQFKKIQKQDISQQLINEIIELYKEVGTCITIIDAKKNLYQIWFGRNKWRTMKIDHDITLTIKTIPNIVNSGTDGRKMSILSRIKHLFGLEQ